MRKLTLIRNANGMEVVVDDVNPGCNKQYDSKDLSNTSFKINADKVDLSNCVINKSFIYGAVRGKGLSLGGANLSHSHFKNTTFYFAHFQNINAQDTDFTNAFFANTSETWLDFSRTNFTNANLSNVDLSGSKISAVNFKGANLKTTLLADTFWSTAPIIDLTTKIVADTPEDQEKWLQQFEQIHEAIEAGSNGHFNNHLKLENNRSIDKLFMIKRFVDAHPKSIAAAAFKLATQHYKNTQDNNREQLTREIYLEAFKHSGFFSISRCTGQTIFFSRTLERHLTDQNVTSKPKAGSRLEKIKNVLTPEIKMKPTA